LWAVSQIPKERDEAERAIYPLAIAAAIGEYIPGVGYIIQSTTEADHNCVQVVLQYGMQAACRNLLPANKTSVDLSVLYVQGFSFITKAELSELFNTTKWSWDEFTALYRSYNGYRVMSRPGFNDTLDEAIVYVATHCGVTCGQGNLVFLNNVNGSWEVVGTQMVWVS
jgi:hypothetical protein